jgi:hypothetical protein
MKKLHLVSGLAFALALGTASRASASVLPSASELLWGVTDDARLVQFTVGAPETFLISNPISGLRGADGISADPFGNIHELAFDPGTGTLFGLDGFANLYSLDVLTGAASFISDEFSPAGFNAGFAFDPFSGSLRFISDEAENVSITLDGTPVLGANAFYGLGDPNESATPVFVGLGIDPDFGTGYAIDPDLDILAFTVDPNFEEFFTVGLLGEDITGYGSLEVLGDGTLVGALSKDADESSLYVIDTTTGAAIKTGDFGVGMNAIAVPEPGSAAAILGGTALLLGMRRRRA